MGVDVAHLVLVTPGHTRDQVLDKRLDRSEGRDVLSDAMMELDRDSVGRLGNERDREVL